MKRIWLLASLSALSAASAITACSSKSDSSNNDNGGTKNTGNTSSGGDNGNAGDSTGGGTKANAGGAANAGEGGSTTGTGGSAEGGASTGAGITSCGTGTWFAGDPAFNGDTTDIGTSKDGQGLKADPPLRAEQMAFIGKQFYIETETEVWTSDPTVAKPVLNRVAGVEPAAGDKGFLDAGKACSATHFIVIRDMVAKANGKLAVIDYIGNAVVELTNPSAANCTSQYVAGTHVKSDDPGPDYPVLPGDKDGSGATALFGNAANHGGLIALATDTDNNLYVIDNGNNKFKKIANETDKSRTVSTVGVSADGDNLTGLTYLKGKLYAVGVDGTNDILLEIDPAKYDAKNPKANSTEIFRERNHFPDDVDSSQQAVLKGITNDGEALIISGQAGFVWSVGTDGKVLATLAGSGHHIEYENGFDPTMPTPANMWQFVFTNSSGSGPWVAVNDSKLYWSGTSGVGEYQVQFDCK